MLERERWVVRPQSKAEDRDVKPLAPLPCRTSKKLVGFMRVLVRVEVVARTLKLAVILSLRRISIIPTGAVVLSHRFLSSVAASVFAVPRF